MEYEEKVLDYIIRRIKQHYSSEDQLEVCQRHIALAKKLLSLKKKDATNLPFEILATEGWNICLTDAIYKGKIPEVDVRNFSEVAKLKSRDGRNDATLELREKYAALFEGLEQLIPED